MNPNIDKLKPYPFERLKDLKTGITPKTDKHHIPLSIGEPRHTPPQFICDELTAQQANIGGYPPTKGLAELRISIANWLINRFQLDKSTIDSERNILPVSGTREALFAIAQATVDRKTDPIVVMPNPFYQIYEGAALLAGAQPWFQNTTAQTSYLPDFDAVPESVWLRCQLIYICSPGNPTGAIIDAATLTKLLTLSEKYDFIIASDECYSEIYFDEQNPPVGLLQVAHQIGLKDYKRCVVFHSLSKRSNVPGIRSGFVAGDASFLDKFLLYRTYHGCGTPSFIQLASKLAWEDETHVIDNRALYRKKFKAVLDILKPVLDVKQPDAGFYLWPKTPIDDTVFARELFAQQNVTVLPGSYLSREAHGINPGQGYVRIALVASLEECIDAAQRIRSFVSSLA
ncbi:MAG: succinyldiaminopimelate transaminase [Gammaproteobacteria bacterium]|nr:succinyldiaminopimelate transaminase [Gammaproteobacteria bacterium]